ncbi:KH domain-containing protein HEN4 [Aristolochia californica]|uniref:KH domain-containing protein HEN4 n=1 Tax=Aristolochia californica TaxID=171875 RepID=UPI0035E14DE8
MEPSSFVSPPSAKRPLDPSSDAHRVDYNGSASFVKRRHHSLIRHPPPPLKLSHGETLFRVLCPADKTGAVIGKGGAIIRHFRQSTGAKIRIEDTVASSDERVILIVAPNVVDPVRKPKDQETEANSVSNLEKKDENPREGEMENFVEDDLVSASPAQQALVKVFERMVRVDEERLMGGSGEGDEGEERVGSATAGITTMHGLVVCRLLAPSNQVGCVLGKGGKIVEKIRQESGAQIRILSKEQLPACAAAGDELIQISGNVASVRRALLSVSSCLQDNPRSDAANFFSSKPSGPMLRGLGPPGQLEPFPQRGFVPPHPPSDYFSRESLASGHRNALEEEIVFRLLCSSDKVGSLIGKGGGIVRTLQIETGALIKVLESMPDSDEQVVFISAVENMELKHSPAQEAVMRVFSRLAEMGSDSALVSVRLLVPAQQIGCLLGKGGNIIAEMRRATGASIRIFVNEHVPKCAAPNDEVVQVNGTMQSVQDALFHITSRLRESILPIRPNVGGGQYMSVGPETPPFLFRARHEPTSPRHLPPSMGHPHGPRLMDRQPSLSRGMDHVGLANVDRGPHSFSSERPGPGPTYDRPSSPRSWAPPAVSSGNVRGVADTRTASTPRNDSLGSGSQVVVVTSTSVEVMVPQQFLGFIYGDNGSNLNQLRQISGAKVIIHDPSSGATEGNVVITGTPDQTQAAQSLLQAFILCGQTSSSS